MSDSQGAAGCPTARCERLDSCATTKPSCQHTSREHRQSSTASWPHADLSGGPRMVRARLVSSYQAAEAQESCPSSIMDHIIAAVAGAQTQSLRACAPGSSSTLRPAPLSHSGRWSRPPPCENGAAGRFVRPQGAIQFAYLGLRTAGAMLKTSRPGPRPIHRPAGGPQARTFGQRRPFC